MYSNRTTFNVEGQNPLYPFTSEQISLAPIKRKSKIRSHYFPKAPHNTPEIRLDSKKISHPRISKSNSSKHLNKERVSKPRFHSIVNISKKGNQIIDKTSLEIVSQSPTSEKSISTKKVRHRHKRAVAVSESNNSVGETKNVHKDHIASSLRDPSIDIIISFLSQKFKTPFDLNGFDLETTNNLVNKLASVIFKLNQNPSECNLRITKNYSKTNSTNYDATFNVKSTLEQNADNVEKSVDKISNIHIHLYFPIQNPIAKIAVGGWKAIKNSFTFILPGGDVESILIIPSVVQRALKNVTFTEYLQVLCGIQHQATLNDVLDADHQLAVAPSFVLYPTKDGCQRLELEQAWYNGTFCELRDGLPLTRKINPEKVYYGDSTILDILINQAETLHLLHQQGIVHGDVKGTNILIKINKEQKAKGFLSDPDYINFLGYSDEAAKPYVYWDLARHYGFSFASCDTHGLVITGAADFLPFKIEKMDPKWLEDFASNKFYQGTLMQNIAFISLQDLPDIKNLCLSFTLAHNKTSLEILQMFQSIFLGLYKNPDLSEKEKKDLKRIETDLVVFEKILTMLANQINLERELWSKIRYRPDFIKIFKSDNTKEKKNLYDEIVNSIPNFPTAKDISERFKEIKILLQ